jgi:hypothetical protein
MGLVGHCARQIGDLRSDRLARQIPIDGASKVKSGYARSVGSLDCQRDPILARKASGPGNTVARLLRTIGAAAICTARMTAIAATASNGRGSRAHGTDDPDRAEQRDHIAAATARCGIGSGALFEAREVFG